MKEFVLEGDAVLCEPLPGEDGGLEIAGGEGLTVYRVVKTGSDRLEPKLSPGDVVVCESRGGEFQADGRTYSMFRYGNIAGKVLRREDGRQDQDKQDQKR